MQTTHVSCQGLTRTPARPVAARSLQREDAAIINTNHPHSAPLATLGGRGMADAVPSPASATHEAERLAGIRKMHRSVAAARIELGQRKYINLRDGSLMPPEPVNHSPLYAWIALLVAGMAFWTWALPKVVRAVADSIVIGANGYY